MDTITVADAGQSFLSTVGFWDGLFWVVVVGICLFCLIVGNGSIFNRIKAAFLMNLGWVILFIPLWLLGSLFGAVSENDKVGQPDPTTTVVEQPATGQS